MNPAITAAAPERTTTASAAPHETRRQSGFIGTYPAVLAFSLLLAALCLLSLARIATALGPDRAASR
jgi:hypothetical protein